MLEALVDPWTHEFVRMAFAALALAGISGGALGCWVVFYELSYSAESLAHSLFPGLIAAALLGVPLLLGGAVGVAAAAGAVAVFGRTPEIGRDTAVAVVVTTLFGLGVMLALAPESPRAVNELLFGNVLAVTGTDLAVSAALTAGVLLALALLHRRLLVVGFDRGSARALGVRTLPVDLALLALIAAAVVVSVQALGNLLVVAVLVGPAATARLLVRRLAPMMALAAAIAVAAAIVGLYLSYYAELAAGASVAAATVAAFLLALAFSPALLRDA